MNREPELHSVLDELDDSVTYLEDLCADLGDRRLQRLVRLMSRVLVAIQREALDGEESARGDRSS